MLRKTKPLTEEEIDSHLVDWARVGADEGHIWRFPPTEFCEHRLLEEDITTFLPCSQKLLQV